MKGSKSSQEVPRPQTPPGIIPIPTKWGFRLSGDETGEVYPTLEKAQRALKIRTLIVNKQLPPEGAVFRTSPKGTKLFIYKGRSNQPNKHGNFDVSSLVLITSPYPHWVVRLVSSKWFERLKPIIEDKIEFRVTDQPPSPTSCARPGPMRLVETHLTFGPSYFEFEGDTFWETDDLKVGWLSERVIRQLQQPVEHKHAVGETVNGRSILEFLPIRRIYPPHTPMYRVLLSSGENLLITENQLGGDIYLNK